MWWGVKFFVFFKPGKKKTNFLEGFLIIVITFQNPQTPVFHRILSSMENQGLDLASRLRQRFDSEVPQDGIAGAPAPDPGPEGSHEKRAPRLRGKIFFLTYEKVWLSKRVFSEKWGRGEYDKLVICHETGFTAIENKHTHVLIKLKDKIDTTDMKYFDRKDAITDTNPDGHPNIRHAGKKPKQFWEQKHWYCHKQDTQCMVRGGMIFDTPNGFNKKKKDVEDWLQYVRARDLKDPWPLKISGSDRSVILKDADTPRRISIFWIVGRPGFGKTKWIEDTFEGKKIFKPSRGAHPFDNYEGQPIIIYDDWKFLHRDMLIDTSNYYKTQTPCWGQQRYNVRYWPIRQQRFQIIVCNELNSLIGRSEIASRSEILVFEDQD